MYILSVLMVKWSGECTCFGFQCKRVYTEMDYGCNNVSFTILIQS